MPTSWPLTSARVPCHTQMNGPIFKTLMNHTAGWGRTWNTHRSGCSNPSKSRRQHASVVCGGWLWNGEGVLTIWEQELIKELDCWWTKKKISPRPGRNYLLRWEVGKNRAGSGLRNPCGSCETGRERWQAGQHKSGLRGMWAEDNCDRQPLCAV